MSDPKPAGETELDINVTWGMVTRVLVVPMILVLAVSAVGAYHQVPEGHAGVETQWGAVTGHIDEPGANWKVPLMEGIQNVETRPRTYTMAQDVDEGARQDADAVAVKTVNGSTVRVDITVRYRIDGERADAFVEEWNHEGQMENRLIRPTVRTQLRDEASSLQTTGPGSIYTTEGRERLEQTAIDALRDEFQGQPIILEAVQIRNIDLPDEIDATLDQKEQAKQQVEVERERVKQEEQRAEQKRIRARANADVIRIEGEALRDNRIVLEQQLIDAYGEGTVFVTDGGAPVILDAGGVGGNETDGG